MSAIFTTETITKGNIYQRIKELLVANGWTNVSSKPATDFDIFYSKGVAKDKELYFQLQDPGGLFTTGTQAFFNIKMINKYTPGAAGVSGTFDSSRSSEPWRNLYIFSGSALPYADTPITFSYSINADRIVFVTEPPLIMNTVTSSNICYIGAMALYESEPNCRSLVVVQAMGYYTGLGSTTGIVVTSTPYSDTTASYALSPYRINTLSEYNNNDVRFISEIGVGSAAEGLRGKLDGIYCLYINANSRTSSGDTLTDGTNTYRVIYVSALAGYNKLFNDTNTLYAIQIS
jgi:hypothetical protein